MELKKNVELEEIVESKNWLGGMELELAWNSNWCELELSVELE